MSLIQTLEQFKDLSPDQIVAKINPPEFWPLSYAHPKPDPTPTGSMLIQMTERDERTHGIWTRSYGASEDGHWYYREPGRGLTGSRAAAYRYTFDEAWAAARGADVIVIRCDE